MPILPCTGKGTQGDNYKKRCHSQSTIEQFREKYGDAAYPACPWVTKLNPTERGSQRAVSYLNNLRDEIVFGGIKWPHTLGKKGKTSETSHLYGLMEAIEYILMYAEYWLNEDLDLTPELEMWYEGENPFSHRLVPIISTCENILDISLSQLPNHKERFNEHYQRLKSVASKIDNTTGDLIDRIVNFKTAVDIFRRFGLVLYTEAKKQFEQNQQLGEGEKTEGTKNGQGTNPRQPKKKWVFNECQVFYDGIDLDISGLALEVLKIIVEADGSVVTKSSLQDEATRYAHYIGDIRKKLKAEGIPCTIKTVTGEGYKLIYAAK